MLLYVQIISDVNENMLIVADLELIESQKSKKF
jgi:hypothetical protein